MLKWLIKNRIGNKMLNGQLVSLLFCSGNCLSEDEKPVGGKIANGSCLVEMDTGKIFFYDEEGEQWIEFVNTGGGGGGGGSKTVKRKDVNLVDYDGTVVYSYTAAEFADLSALPDAPKHNGLTAQGWNWSLADAKAYAAAHGELDISQNYITADGKTRVYITLGGSRLSPSVRFGVNGTAVIEWGDGTASSTLTGANINTIQSASHTYANPGSYVIKIAVTGKIRISGQNGSSRFIYGATGDASIDMLYPATVQKIEFGSGIELGTYALAYCRQMAYVIIPDGTTWYSADHAMNNCTSLKAVTLPSGTTDIYSDAFSWCSSLTSVSIPNTVTSIGQYAFQNCGSLAYIAIPNSVTSVDTYAFNACNLMKECVISGAMTGIPGYMLYECVSLDSLTVPASVTSIGQYAIGACSVLSEIHFKRSTPPTVSASNAFSGLPADCVIYVPTGSLSAYTGATNYPSASRNVYIEE